MSGGSWDYLYSKELEDLLNRQRDLQDMADRLASLGYAGDAAKETQELLLVIRQMENRCNTMMRRLSGVWRAVEWWDSCDSDEDGLRNALVEYRGGDDEVSC